MECKIKKQFLAIFDLDGTLFDTSDVNYYSYRDALLPYNVNLDKEYFVKRCNGRHYTEFIPLVMGNTNYLEEVHIAKKNAYLKNVNKAKVNIHLFNMIKLMRNDYYIAIVTTASRKNSIDILSYFGYQELFELLITQEDITNVKPNPEGFIKAMDSFGIDKSHTIIFEDSEVGIQAAKSSGASVMVVNKF